LAPCSSPALFQVWGEDWDAGIRLAVCERHEVSVRLALIEVSILNGARSIL
jgi:hypothetical protein